MIAVVDEADHFVTDRSVSAEFTVYTLRREDRFRRSASPYLALAGAHDEPPSGSHQQTQREGGEPRKREMGEREVPLTLVSGKMHARPVPAVTAAASRPNSERRSLNATDVVEAEQAKQHRPRRAQNDEQQHVLHA